jgi:4-carboxymuconolactone decarboxylase
MKRPLGGKGAELAKVAPGLNHYTATLLYEDVWERPGLSKRDRSLVTIAALIAMCRPDQIPGHMQTGLENGLTREEIGEMITHLAFYASWPNAVTAARCLLDLVNELDGKGGAG